MMKNHWIENILRTVFGSALIFGVITTVQGAISKTIYINADSSDFSINGREITGKVLLKPNFPVGNMDLVGAVAYGSAIIHCVDSSSIEYKSIYDKTVTNWEQTESATWGGGSSSDAALLNINLSFSGFKQACGSDYSDSSSNFIELKGAASFITKASAGSSSIPVVIHGVPKDLINAHNAAASCHRTYVRARESRTR